MATSFRDIEAWETLFDPSAQGVEGDGGFDGKGDGGAVAGGGFKKELAGGREGGLVEGRMGALEDFGAGHGAIGVDGEAQAHFGGKGLPRGGFRETPGARGNRGAEADRPLPRTPGGRAKVRMGALQAGGRETARGRAARVRSVQRRAGRFLRWAQGAGASCPPRGQSQKPRPAMRMRRARGRRFLGDMAGGVTFCKRLFGGEFAPPRW